MTDNNDNNSNPQGNGDSTNPWDNGPIGDTPVNPSQASPPPPPPFGETPASPQPPQDPIVPTPYDPMVQPGTTPPPPPPYQAPAQGTYYSNTQGYNAAGPKNDPFAITSLATGVPAIILAVCCGPLGFIGVIVGIIATVFGFLSLGRIEKSQGQLSGKGLTIGGLSCGIGAIVLGLGFTIFFIAIG